MNDIKLNIVLTTDSRNVITLERWLRSQDTLEVVDFKVLPDTTELYDNDPVFKKMVDAKRKQTREMDRYRNGKK